MCEWLGKLDGWEALKNHDEISIFVFPDAQKSSFGVVWGACLRVLRVSGSVLVRVKNGWNVSRARFGVSGLRLGGVLGPSWDILGKFWSGLGESWRLPGNFLGAFLQDVLPS